MKISRQFEIPSEATRRAAATWTAPALWRFFTHAESARGQAHSKTSRRGGAFTLLELLVVIGIIALIAAIAVPNLNSMRPNLLAVASSQLLGDLGWARQRAISDHTTVYVVFVPSCAGNLGGVPANLSNADRDRLLQGQYVSYAFYVKRQLGDQPGSPTVRFLTGWKSLPSTVAFAPQKFGSVAYASGYNPSIVSAGGSNVCWTFDATSVQCNPDVTPPPTASFPYIAFDYRGSLASSWHTDGAKAGHCVIPLTRGSMSLPRDATGALAWQAPTFTENPVGGWNDPTLYTYIVIDGPTGRAHVEHAQVQ